MMLIAGLLLGLWVGYVVGNPKRIYDSRGNAIMLRYRPVSTPWFGMYVHHIVGPDEITPHDHPWSSVSIIMWGGYIEEFVTKRLRAGYVTEQRSHRLGDVIIRKATDAHRIAAITAPSGGAWTLFLVSRKTRNWGYLTDHGWVQWQAFWKPS